MLSQFIAKKLKGAHYKLLKDGSYFAELPGIRGVWANASNLEDCRMELQEVLESWLLLKIRDQEKIPGFSIRTNHRQPMKHA